MEVYEPPIVIVDLGTACVFDAIDAEGAYVGGAIAPGIGLASNALFDKAAMLRTVKLDAPETAIGNTTAHALQSGICLDRYLIAMHVQLCCQLRFLEHLTSPFAT